MTSHAMRHVLLHVLHVVPRAPGGAPGLIRGVLHGVCHKRLQELRFMRDVRALKGIDDALPDTAHPISDGCKSHHGHASFQLPDAMAGAKARPAKSRQFAPAAPPITTPSRASDRNSSRV
jgi:hypothetical protein